MQTRNRTILRVIFWAMAIWIIGDLLAVFIPAYQAWVARP